MCVHVTLATPGSGLLSASLMKAKLVEPDNRGTGSMSISSRKEHGLSEQGTLGSGTAVRPRLKDFVKNHNGITRSLIISCSFSQVNI